MQLIKQSIITILFFLIFATTLIKGFSYASNHCKQATTNKQDYRYCLGI